MAFQDPWIRLERLAAVDSITLQGQAEFTLDAIGNLTVTWTDPLASRASPRRLTRADLAPYASENVEQQRNRAGAYLCVTDPGGALLRVTWREVDPWTGVLTPEQTLYGVVSLTAASATSARDVLTLIAYRADHRYSRGSGLLETRP